MLVNGGTKFRNVFHVQDGQLNHNSVEKSWLALGGQLAYNAGGQLGSIGGQLAHNVVNRHG